MKAYGLEGAVTLHSDASGAPEKLDPLFDPNVWSRASPIIVSKRCQASTKISESYRWTNFPHSTMKREFGDNVE